jgi:hypothetical protein
LERSGFALVATYTLQEEATSADRAQGRADRTYICKKITS